MPDKQSENHSERKKETVCNVKNTDDRTPLLNEERSLTI